MTVLIVAAAVLGGIAFGEDLPSLLHLHGGKAIYDAACAACHGNNGGGASEAATVFDRPGSFPHFNKCDETSPEYTRDYVASVRNGGPARGFSTIMPSFSGVLTARQINEVVAYLRTFCKEPGWTFGELNVPRALMTEKAFPESETVVTTTLNAKGPAGGATELVYERILAKHDQLELAIPFNWVTREGGGKTGGLGDIAVGDKHVLYSRLHSDPNLPPYEATGSIFSIQGEIVLPTGNQRRGLGSGEPSLGIFAMYDHVFPRLTFLQIQSGIDIPRHTEYTPRSVYSRAAFGRSFSGDQGLGRTWSPMIELIANRDLTPGTKTDVDVIPEFQVTLNRRQHIRAAFGYRLPLTHTFGRPKQFIGYVLWDWFDGGLFEGW